MYTHDTPIGELGRAAAVCWFPLMMRDVLFRSMIIGSYYATTDIRHKPVQKYTMPQIVDFMKQRRAQNRARGEPLETHNQLSYLFYEFHNYDVQSKMTTRISLLILSNLFATLVTNPFDVCLTKLATQQRVQPQNKWKYAGFVDCLRTVFREEGWRKLMLGGIHPRFMFNAFNGLMFLFIYDRFVHEINSSAS